MLSHYIYIEGAQLTVVLFFYLRLCLEQFLGCGDLEICKKENSSRRGEEKSRMFNFPIGWMLLLEM